MLLIVFALIYLTLSCYFILEKEKIYYLSAILFVTICYIVNEVFSVFSILDFEHLVICYLLLCGVLVIFLIKKLKKDNAAINRIKDICKIRILFNDKFMLLMGVFTFVMLVLALYTVPYNWDSMTYHLSRIMQWTQNKSVAHYAVRDIRQLTSPVLAEFINLQVYILGREQGNLFNLLQFTSFITNASLLYYISKKIGVSKKFCQISVVLFISMPIAFGEALTTQVDHFSTMWLLMFVYFLLDILDVSYCLKYNKDSLWRVAVLSGCIAYGYLAKPSVMFGIVFFAIWLLVVCIYRKDNWKDIIVLLVISASIIVLTLLPEVLRNINSFNAISAPVAGARQLVGTKNPIYLFVNWIKNLMMNMPNIYFDFTRQMERIVHLIAYALKVDINHPSIAEDGKEFYLHHAQNYDHDTAINPVIVISMLLVILWLAIRRLKKEKWLVGEIFSYVAIISFMFFCMILRWEPFVTRYMLSYLALLCPVVAFCLENIKNKKASYAATSILIFVCIVELFGLFKYHGAICRSHNEQEEPLAPHFVVRESVKMQYIELVHLLNEEKFDSLGIYLDGDIWEYPIWSGLEEKVRIENVMVNNESTKYVDETFVPEAIVVIGINGILDESVLNYNGEKYECYQVIDENFSVWTINGR